MRLEISRRFDNDVTLAATYLGLAAVVDQQLDQRRSRGNHRAGVLTVFADFADTFTGLDNSLGYTYSSQIENVEFNAMLRLNPANPYWDVEWLGGIRYIYYAEDFTLAGSDIASGASEQLASTTTNNLIGLQTGFLFVRGWSHFQWEIGLKAGLMANMYHQRIIDSAVNAPTGFNPYDVSSNGTGLAALFEASLGVRYRLTENFGLRLGYQFYDITGLALAPRQLSSFGHGGNVALDGFSVGLQANW